MFNPFKKLRDADANKRVIRMALARNLFKTARKGVRKLDQLFRIIESLEKKEFQFAKSAQIEEVRLKAVASLFVIIKRQKKVAEILRTDLAALNDNMANLHREFENEFGQSALTLPKASRHRVDIFEFNNDLIKFLRLENDIKELFEAKEKLLQDPSPSNLTKYAQIITQISEIRKKYFTYVRSTDFGYYEPPLFTPPFTI